MNSAGVSRTGITGRLPHTTHGAPREPSPAPPAPGGLPEVRVAGLLGSQAGSQEAVQGPGGHHLGPGVQGFHWGTEVSCE